MPPAPTPAFSDCIRLKDWCVKHNVSLAAALKWTRAGKVPAFYFPGKGRNLFVPKTADTSFLAPRAAVGVKQPSPKARRPRLA